MFGDRYLLVIQCLCRYATKLLWCSAGIGGGNDEREQTLNQLLTEMDGL